jgi:hypothetical protein
LQETADSLELILRQRRLPEANGQHSEGFSNGGQNEALAETSAHHDEDLAETSAQAQQCSTQTVIDRNVVIETLKKLIIILNLNKSFQIFVVAIHGCW